MCLILLTQIFINKSTPSKLYYLNQKKIHYKQDDSATNHICVHRDLSIIGLFLFTIPRIFNTKNDTIQYQKTIPPKNNFFILLHFLPFQTILSIFWKSPFLGPKKAHIMGIWAENHPFGVFSYKCLELSNSSRNGIKIQSWIVLNIIE